MHACTVRTHSPAPSSMEVWASRAVVVAQRRAQKGKGNPHSSTDQDGGWLQLSSSLLNAADTWLPLPARETDPPTLPLPPPRSALDAVVGSQAGQASTTLSRDCASPVLRTRPASCSAYCPARRRVGARVTSFVSPVPLFHTRSCMV